MLLGKFFGGCEADRQAANLVLKGLGDMFHDTGIQAKPCHQQEVILRPRCCLQRALTYFLLLLFSPLLLFVMGYAWTRQALNFDMYNIDLASCDVSDVTSCFHKIARYYHLIMATIVCTID